MWGYIVLGIEHLLPGVRGGGDFKRVAPLNQTSHPQNEKKEVLPGSDRPLNTTLLCYWAYTTNGGNACQEKKEEKKRILVSLISH